MVGGVAAFDFLGILVWVFLVLTTPENEGMWRYILQKTRLPAQQEIFLIIPIDEYLREMGKILHG